jgi:hypothetical protein
MKTLSIPLVMLALVAGATTARLAHAGPAFEEARVLLERGHHADAHRRFARLADCGHREAARIALEMRQFGPQLYRMNFQIGPKQLARWRALLAAPAPRPGQGSAVAGLACEVSAPAEEASDEQAYWRHQGVG